MNSRRRESPGDYKLSPYTVFTHKAKTVLLNCDIWFQSCLWFTKQTLPSDRGHAVEAMRGFGEQHL